MSVQSLAFLKSKLWWRQAIGTALPLAQEFAVPAGGLAIANMVMLAGAYSIYGALKAQDVTIEMLTKAAVTGVSTAVLALVLSFWILAIWLVRLTAYCRLLLESPEASSQKNLRISDMRKNFATCLAETRKRKKLLVKMWLIGSVYMLIPGIVFSVLLTSQTLATTKYGIPGMSVPVWVSVVTTAMLLLATIIIAAFTFVLMVVSAITNQSAGEAAGQAVKLLRQYWKPLSLATCLVLILNTLISAPQTIFSVWQDTGLNLESSPMFGQLALQAWLGITSVILWPLSLAPFCSLLKDKIN